MWDLVEGFGRRCGFHANDHAKLSAHRQQECEIIFALSTNYQFSAT
jgi:hypothetical protein